MPNDTAERWLPIPGFEGWYEASDQGRIRSVERTLVVLLSGKPHRRTYKSRVLRPSINPESGYQQLILNRQGKSYPYPVHQLVVRTFHGPRPPGYECLHRDGVRLNCRANNLHWGTRSENGYDRVRHGNNRQHEQTHCLRGHELRPPNLAPCRGNRNCLACRKALAACRYRLRARGEVYDVQAVADGYYSLIMEGRPIRWPLLT